MESYDEFDDASTLKRKYRNLMTEDQYEMQGSLETHKALGDLMDYIEKHPEKYHSILQNKRKEEYENSSGFSFLKSKILSVIGLEEMLPCHVSQQECNRQIKGLKLSMSRAFNYAQDAKGRRYSKRLAFKDLSPRGKEHPKPSTAPPPPPPPLPPALPPPSQLKSGSKTPQKGKDTDESHADSSCNESDFSTPVSSPQKHVNGIKENGQTIGSGLTSKSQLNSVKKNGPSTPYSSIAEEILSRRSINRLRSTNLPKSPGGTPVRSGSKSKTQSISSDPLTQAFNEAFEKKFRNIRNQSISSQPEETWEDQDLS